MNTRPPRIPRMATGCAVVATYGAGVGAARLGGIAACRRAARLEPVARTALPDGPVTLVIDSTGLKVYGASEMQAPIHPALTVGAGLQGFQDALPNPRPAPAIEPAGDGTERAIPLRQVPPRRSAAGDPQHAVDHASVRVVRAASARLFGRKQRLQPLPLRVGQFIAPHSAQIGNALENRHSERLNDHENDDCENGDDDPDRRMAQDRGGR